MCKLQIPRCRECHNGRRCRRALPKIAQKSARNLRVLARNVQTFDPDVTTSVRRRQQLETKNIAFPAPRSGDREDRVFALCLCALARFLTEHKRSYKKTLAVNLHSCVPWRYYALALGSRFAIPCSSPGSCGPDSLPILVALSTVPLLQAAAQFETDRNTYLT